MSLKSIFASIKSAIVGKPLTPEQAKVHQENQRLKNQGAPAERANSMMNQGNMF